MQRWRGLDGVPTGWGRSVVTVGVFDGVHRGHQQLIARTVERARARGLPSVLVTFDPHPAELIRPGSHPARLTTLRRRAELVAELGVDAFYVLPFDQALKRMEPAAFAHEVLVDRLHAAEVVVGRNFTFGYRAAGDVPMLTGLGARVGFAVEGRELISDDGVTFSSTYIRACIDAGDVTAAAAALGRPHRVEGVVVHGDHRGRELGFPTANIATGEWTALPADGVYAGHLVLGGRTGERALPSALSVGPNPTFSGQERPGAVYALAVDELEEGLTAAAAPEHWLRGQERYTGIDALVAQIRQDVARTRELLEP